MTAVRPGARGSAAPLSDPSRHALAAADGQPMQVCVRAFLRDPLAVARACRLLRSVSGALRPSGRGTGIVLETSDASDLASPPLGFVLLTDAAHLGDCCVSLSAFRSAWPAVPTFVLADGISEEQLDRLLACGPVDFCLLSGSDAEIGLRLRRAFGLLPTSDPSADSELPRELSSRLLGRAPAFLRMVRRVPMIAASPASVLLLGETGTGKEVCAQAIHYSSPRARGPWVAINCAAIPSELVESELFGHTRGAYTHAMAAREGLVQEAECGTLFLDEIDSMPLAAQAKVLRFVQEKEYRLVGSSERRTADVRVIAASNRDLRRAAAAGTFRQDLFFRLNVLNLTLPPLRERREDIPALAMHFLAEANRENGRSIGGLAPAALRALMAHSWPGNVRELKHVIQRAVLLAQNSTVQASAIEIDGETEGAPQDDVDGAVSFREAKARAVEAFERQFLEQLLAQCRGNITQAARAAGKNRRAFFELLRRHAIDATLFRTVN